MHKNRFIIIGTVVFFALILSGFNVKPPVDHQLNSGKYGFDTTSFMPNAGSGWSIIASYIVQVGPDSVQLELLLKRTTRIGKADNLIGTITNTNFYPAKNQRLDYYLLGDNVWIIRINTNGECYLKQDRGSDLKPSSLPGSPDVIPIKVRFKKT